MSLETQSSRELHLKQTCNEIARKSSWAYEWEIGVQPYRFSISVEHEYLRRDCEIKVLSHQVFLGHHRNRGDGNVWEQSIRSSHLPSEFRAQSLSRGGRLGEDASRGKAMGIDKRTDCRFKGQCVGCRAVRRGLLR